MTISLDLMNAILSMDSYNRGYGQVVLGLSTSGQIGSATIRTQSNTAAGSDEVNAGFYAIAYNVSGAGIDGLTGTVIAYRGSDYEDTNGDILRSNDLWQGWTLGAVALQRRKGAM